MRLVEEIDFVDWVFNASPVLKERTDVKPAEREKKTVPIVQIEKLEKKMSQAQEKS